MLGCRVESLQGASHAGIRVRGDLERGREALEALGYGFIDLVVVNLYPFEESVAAGAGMREAMEEVDIGGPTLLRAAAKNHASVTIVCDPGDYDRVLEAFEGGGGSAEFRLELAQEVCAYDVTYTA